MAEYNITFKKDHLLLIRNTKFYKISYFKMGLVIYGVVAYVMFGHLFNSMKGDFAPHDSGIFFVPFLVSVFWPFVPVVYVLIGFFKLSIFLF